jgi:hypothetical protein
MDTVRGCGIEYTGRNEVNLVFLVNKAIKICTSFEEVIF